MKSLNLAAVASALNARPGASAMAFFDELYNSRQPIYDDA